MKKNILKIGILTVITAFITMFSMNINLNEQNNINSLLFDNIEALASSSEGGSSKAHRLECGKGTIKLCKAKCGRCLVELEVWGAGSPATLYCPLN